MLAGALLFRDDQIAFAIVVWLLTFVAGAGMMVAAAISRALASLLARLAHLESDVTVLLGRAADDAAPGRPPADRRW